MVTQAITIDAKNFTRFFNTLSKDAPKILRKVTSGMGTDIRRQARLNAPALSGNFRDKIRKRTRGRFVTVSVEDPRAFAWEFGMKKTHFIHRDMISPSGYLVGDALKVFQQNPTLQFVRVPKPGSPLAKGVRYMTRAANKAPLFFRKRARESLAEIKRF